jgi:hypothetical protein
MIKLREMVRPPIHLVIRIPCTFGPEPPDCPVFPMLIIKELDKFIVGISISALGIGTTRTRRGNDLWGYITEIETIL